MIELKKTVTRSGAFELFEAPERLSPFVSVFVHRDEHVDGRAVRILPELRSSIQVRLADPYWVRERTDASPWRRAPDISLWAPRHNWGYGYVSSRSKVFACGLTPAGFQAIVGKPVGPFVDTILDISDYPMLSSVVAARQGEGFLEWTERLSKALIVLFRDADPTPAISTRALDMLATSAGGAVTRAAAIEDTSPRQFRRRFASIYGLGPKRYQRIVRVDRQLRRLHPDPWEHDHFHAASISFADQPHAIREFHDTIGMTPRQYQQLKTNADATLRAIPEPQVNAPFTEL
jgi:AraC-like DNA-binding protein